MKKAIITVIALLLVVMSLTAWSQPPSLPAGLPPRPTVEPIAGDTPYEGGLIELRLSGMTEPLWTAVQWQDAFGNWHTVEGWRGTIDLTQVQQWWVNAENLGEQNFRWRIYTAPNGDLLATSETFDLPAHNLQKVIVPVELEP